MNRNKAILILLSGIFLSVFGYADNGMQVYVVSGDTIDELNASMDDPSTWKPAVIVEPTIDIERPLADRISFQVTKSLYDLGLLGLLSSFLPNNDSELSFSGAELLRRYGAGNEYIQKLDKIYIEGKELFNVGSAMVIVEDSNNARAWATINKPGDGNISIALFNSYSEVFTDLEHLKDYTIYHELSHIAFQRDVGGVLDLNLPEYELRDAYLFGEYGNDVYAQRVLPEDKRQRFIQSIKNESGSINYENVKIAFRTAEYGFLLRMAARAREHSLSSLEEYINTALMNESPEFRQEFLELSDEFYIRAHALNKGNFVENTRVIVEKIGELRNLD
jgi:hypothetical protein